MAGPETQRRSLSGAGVGAQLRRELVGHGRARRQDGGAVEQSRREIATRRKDRRKENKASRFQPCNLKIENYGTHIKHLRIKMINGINFASGFDVFLPRVQLSDAERRDSSSAICSPRLHLLLQEVLQANIPTFIIVSSKKHTIYF